jgi:hypothetical protein
MLAGDVMLPYRGPLPVRCETSAPNFPIRGRPKRLIEAGCHPTRMVECNHNPRHFCAAEIGQQISLKRPSRCLETSTPSVRLWTADKSSLSATPPRLKLNQSTTPPWLAEMPNSRAIGLWIISNHINTFKTRKSIKLSRVPDKVSDNSRLHHSRASTCTLTLHWIL